MKAGDLGCERAKFMINGAKIPSMLFFISILDAVKGMYLPNLYPSK